LAAMLTFLTVLMISSLYTIWVEFLTQLTY